MEIFKAYDVRGIYPDDLNEEFAHKIARALVKFLNCKKVIVGRDMRMSSPSLHDSVVKGLAEQGADVIDIGLCSSPMMNFASAIIKADGAMMITASHNPKEYNGFKFFRDHSIPISEVSGLKDIEKLANKENFEDAAEKGKVSQKDIMDDYIKHVKKFAEKIKGLKIVIDSGNGMSGLTVPKVLEGFGIELIHMYPELDGSFPNHECNPMKEENTSELQKKVVEEKADVGISFDGDADRVVFIDENGKRISSDIITALIAIQFLKKGKEKILYDLRSSKAVKETIEENGGEAIMCKVGHSFIKQQLRDENAIFAGELSGHYYFKDNFFTDSGVIALIMILNLLSAQEKKLSEIVKPIKKYFATGETNMEVEEKDAVLEKIKKKYSDANVFELDGVSVEYNEWWFNVRKSNTEPLLRLNLEADTKKLMEEKRDEVIVLIKSN